MAKENQRNIQLVGFKYSKINVEKNEDFEGELKISPNINIEDIIKDKPNLAKKEFLKVKFGFEVDYFDLGKISLKGFLVLSCDDKTTKEILTSWKARKFEDSLNSMIVNVIMQKASVKALSLEEEFNFPYHIQIPRLQIQGKKE